MRQNKIYDGLLKVVCINMVLFISINPFIFSQFQYVNHCSISCSMNCTTGDSLFEQSEIVYPSSVVCPGNFVLVFDDEFNDASLDLDNWQTGLSWANTNGVYYKPDNVELSGGLLKLIAKHEPGNYPGGSISYEYTIGGIISSQSFSSGKFEISCKLPNIDGLWPAFWLVGMTNGCYIEIDAFELNNDDINQSSSDANKKIFMTYHSDGNCTGQNKYGDGYNFCNSTDYSQSFHTYSVEWDEYKIIWRIDNQEARSVYRYKYCFYNNLGQLQCNNLSSCDDLKNLSDPAYLSSNPNFPIGEMQVIINTMVRNFGTESNPQWRGTYPSIMEVDYIRIYQKKIESCCPDYKLYENTNHLPPLTHVKNFIKAGYDAGIPNTAGGVVVQSGQTVVFRAGDHIEIGPGFHTQSGAVFIAEPEECLSTSNTNGDPIVIVHVPPSIIDGSSFCIEVQGADVFSVIVKNWLGTTIFTATDVPITSNYACIWDGSGVGSGACNNHYTLGLGLANCNQTKGVLIDVIYECPSAKTSSKNDNNTDSVHKIAHNQKIISDSLLPMNMEKNEKSSFQLNDNGTIPYFSVKPNLTAGRTVVYFSPENITGFARLEIIDVLGRPVFVKNNFAPGIANPIDLSRLQKGIYFLKISTEDDVWIEKIVLE